MYELESNRKYFPINMGNHAGFSQFSSNAMFVKKYWKFIASPYDVMEFSMKNLKLQIRKSGNTIKGKLIF